MLRTHNLIRVYGLRTLAEMEMVIGVTVLVTKLHLFIPLPLPRLLRLQIAEVSISGLALLYAFVISIPVVR